MKEFNTTRLGLTSAGCFLGAGYVSGQELWKFFGAFGLPGLFGRVLSLAVQFVFVVLLLRLGRETGEGNIGRVLIAGEHPAAHKVAGWVQTLFLFSLCIVMAAGAGALVHQLFGLPNALGGALFCVVTTVVSFRGMDGLARVCAVLVPAMIAATLLISICTLAKTGLSPVLEMKNVNSNPMLPNWFLSAMTYVSYNVFGGIGVLSPIGAHVPDRRTDRRGGLLGVFLLLVISMCILLALGARPDQTAAELPMLALATELHPVLGYVYAALLLCGMLGTTVSFFVAIVIQLLGNEPSRMPRRRPLTILLAVLAFGGSLLGFGGLIGTVYPFFGYLGFAAMALLLYRLFRLRRDARIKAE